MGGRYFTSCPTGAATRAGDRAASTRSYLASRGVDSRRIIIDGMGERYPIATNDTAEGRARNRRVEIFVGERPRG